MQAQQIIGGNFCLSKAGLTGISGAASTFTIGTAITYAITGKALSKSTVAGGTTPTTDGVTGKAITLQAGQGTVVVWALDASGNVKAVQGSVEALDLSNNFQFVAPQFPSLPDTLVPFAYTVHKANHSLSTTPFAGGTWTFGTTVWNTTGTSHAVDDVIALPNRPQIN